MSDNPIHSNRISGGHVDPTRTQRQTQSQQLANVTIAQINSEESLGESIEELSFNPFAMARRFETMESRVRRRGKDDETEKMQKEEGRKQQQVEKIAEIAEDFSRRSHQELLSRTLLLLRQRINKNDIIGIFSSLFSSFGRLPLLLPLPVLLRFVPKLP